MRSMVSEYEMKSPSNLNEALKWMEDAPGKWCPFAGGTDLMVLYESGHLAHKNLLNLFGIPELNGIHESSNHLTIGALTTYSQIRKNSLLQKEFPNLCRAASETGAISIQSRGTLGGNIANASPAADSPPALLTYDAEIELSSHAEKRWISYSEFHLGYKKTALRPNELISAIRLPRKREDCFHSYRKVGTRKAQAISKVCIAGVIQQKDAQTVMARIALGSVAPIPIRCKKTEAILIGQKLNSSLIQKAQLELAKEIQPISDIRSTSEYRMRVASNLLGEMLQKAMDYVELDQKG